MDMYMYMYMYVRVCVLSTKAEGSLGEAHFSVLHSPQEHRGGAGMFIRDEPLLESVNQVL